MLIIADDVAKRLEKIETIITLLIIYNIILCKDLRKWYYYRYSTWLINYSIYNSERTAADKKGDL